MKQIKKLFFKNIQLNNKIDDNELSNIEQSYFTRIPNYFFPENIADTTGRFIKSNNNLNPEQIIELNVSVNTINKKQTSIINNCKLKIKEKNNNRDEDTQNQYYNRFLEWLNKPNNSLYPKKIEDIFSYIIRNYNKSGLTGIIFVFKNIKNINYLDSFDKILTPKKLTLETNHELSLKYFAKIKEENQILEFEYSPNYLNFVCQKKGKIYILCPFINFVEEKGQCLSPFSEVLPFIQAQNAAIESAKNYYIKNCIGATIFNIKSQEYSTSGKSANLKIYQAREEEGKRISERLSGAINSGESVVIFSDDLEITKVGQPVISAEIEKMINLCGDKIYASIDGGNRSVFEGLNEYSNNAEIKIEESYKGTIRMANPLICSNFDIFFKNLFLNNETKELWSKFINIENTYFILDTSGVEILKAREIEELKELYKTNLITNSSAVKNLKSIDDKWGNLDENSNLYYSEIDNKMSYDGKNTPKKD